MRSPNLEDDKEESLPSKVKTVPIDWSTKSVLTILLSMLLLASILVRLLLAKIRGWVFHFHLDCCCCSWFLLLGDVRLLSIFFIAGSDLCVQG